MASAAENPTALAFSPDQISDFGQLLARLSAGNLRWLIEQVLGNEGVVAVGDAIADREAFARIASQEMARHGRLHDAARHLIASGDRYFTLGATRILQGRRLDERNLQRTFNDFEPFLSTRTMGATIAKGERVVCAIGCVDPQNPQRGELVGSGFLIGPDLVLTNHHAVEDFVTVDGQTLKATVPGDHIYCFFDYLSPPEPPVPPAGRGAMPLPASGAGAVAVPCAADWLVFGRPLLIDDGTINAPAAITSEYDYVVMRLSAPVGRSRTRQIGAPVRGWFELPTKISSLTADRRVIVFQHPKRAPQLCDVGTYVQPDPSGSRVWYSVNTADGSSGGAAVDGDGRLFALHNSAVDPRPNLAQEVNQGVRIDKIAQDLQAAAPQCLVPAPIDDELPFWSLSDKVDDPQPVLGRKDFRLAIAGMLGTGGLKVASVTGPFGSGVRFSIRLLRRIVGTKVPIVEFSPANLEAFPPAKFVRALINDAGIVGDGRPMPVANSTEDVPRWLRLDLPEWLRDQIAADQKRTPTRYPMWIVVNAVVAADTRLIWADCLRELVAALAGVHDTGQRVIDLPYVRWLFLGRTAGALPVAGATRYDEDLAMDTNYAADFAECLDTAWRSIERHAPTDPQLLINLAASLLRPGDNPRKRLATIVRNTILGNGAAV